jgi:predicted transcriptional regulator of viral defense system
MTTTDEPLLPVLADTGSVLRREALAFGLSQEEIQRLLDHGAWVRIRRGAYAAGDTWESMTHEQRHAVTSHAVVRSLGDRAVLGHTSAAIAHGLPVWGVDLSSVHVVRGARGHGSRREAGVVHHASQLPDGHVTEIGDLQVTTPARTVVDLARTVGFESAVVTMDAALHAGLVTPDDLRELMTWQLDWPGSRAAGRAVAFADGLAESVAESRGRVRMGEAGLPAPELQVNIYDDRGQLVGRGDMVFRDQQTIGECDGRLKYRAATAGRPLEEVLWEEKRREDALRALGWEVVRFTWADLERSPAWIRRMFLAAFARASGRPAPAGFARATMLRVG